MKWTAQYTGWLRQVRFVHWLNNLRHYRKLRRNKAAYVRFGVHRHVTRSLDSRVINRFTDIRSPENKEKLPPPSRPGSNPFPIDMNQALEQWEKNGYLHLRGYFKESTVSAVNREIDSGLTSGMIHFNYTGRKIFNAHRKLGSVDTINSDEGVRAMLHQLFKRPARLFQTINFLKGSEQHPHSDSIHMTTLPLGYLAGVWVALEPIDEDNGPLTYYPGSHRLPYILNEDYGNSSNFLMLDGRANEKYERKVADLIREHSLAEARLSAGPGDVFIWHANLLHGGAPIRNQKRSRKSMVSHYFAEDVVCFHEISERPAILTE